MINKNNKMAMIAAAALALITAMVIWDRSIVSIT